MSSWDFPYAIDPRGRTAATGHADHVRDLVEQLLFTAPGERVNRPTLGSGLMHLLFEPAGDELAGATQLLVQGALQQWLGELIEVHEVAARSDGGVFEVTVRYALTATGELRSETFERSLT